MSAVEKWMSLSQFAACFMAAKVFSVAMSEYDLSLTPDAACDVLWRENNEGKLLHRFCSLGFSF